MYRTSLSALLLPLFFLTSCGGGAGPDDYPPSPTVMIYGRLWYDANQDGIQQPGELPISGVSVYLHLASDFLSFSNTQITDANGYYEFLSSASSAIVRGTDYRISASYLQATDLARDQVHAATGLFGNIELTLRDAGADDRVDSDAHLWNQGDSEYASIPFTMPEVGLPESLDMGFIVVPIDLEGTKDPELR